MKHLYSNCNVWAWMEFCKGKTETLILRKTSYSKWGDIAGSVYWRYTLYPLGVLFGFIAWPFVQLAWFLMYGHWAHVMTDEHEFIPVDSKVHHWIPPILFKGRIKKR